MKKHLLMSAASLLLAFPARAQDTHDAHAGHAMPPAAAMPGHDMQGMHDMPMGMGPNQQSGMKGALGNYAMTRDGSGTSWQPQSSPMEGLHLMWGDWMAMVHGNLTGVYTSQGGPRGDDQFFGQSMAMGMAQRPLGDGRLTLRAMLSLDPFMGKRGYLLLLQTGETADGVSPLVDRQHPHDLFMEMAAIYSHPVGESASVFAYVGYPGEPALGPVTFMHRFSGMANPEAPLGHHWLDATHITFGVTTLGMVIDDRWKIEASFFKGREPDQYRWDFDSFTLDSASTRLSFNPTGDLSFQASYGYIKSPEQLEPLHDQHRLTASVSYNRKLEMGNWQTTLAWGRNNVSGHAATDAFLLETAASLGAHTLFGRVEHDTKDELFEAPSPLAGIAFDIDKFSLGYVFDIPVGEHVSLGLGAMGSVYGIPGTLASSYGSDPASFTLFTRLRLL